MKERKIIPVIVLAIVVLAGAAAIIGIFWNYGDGSFIYQSIRGLDIEIYGKGLYHHMPSDVAIQGIAHDYVTLFIAIPLLLLSLIGYFKKSIQLQFLLNGVLGYVFVTYLFYTAMGMYNFMFFELCSPDGPLLFWIVHLNPEPGTNEQLPVFRNNTR